jgi:hypothetical protein
MVDLYNFAMFASWTTFLPQLIPQIYQDAQLPSLSLQHSQTIQGLATCLDEFTIPHESYTPWTYALAQFTANQRKDWKSAVKSLLEIAQLHRCRTYPRLTPAMI